MGWSRLLDVNQQGFNDYISFLMQMEASKQAKYDAGLDNKISQLMNMKEYDPAAKQNFIDAALQKVGIETKNTRGVKINEALDKIDLHRYGTDYSDIFDFSQPKRGNVARALFGEYDPNYKAPTGEERAIELLQKKDARKEKIKSTFEPMSKNVTATIAENRAKMKANMPKTETTTAEKKTTQSGGKNKSGYKVDNATRNENFIKALQANADMFDTEWLKNIQAQNRMNMSGGK